MTDEEFKENEKYGIALFNAMHMNTPPELTTINISIYENLPAHLKKSLTRDALGLFTRFKTIESGFNGVWIGDKETPNE